MLMPMPKATLKPVYTLADHASGRRFSRATLFSATLASATLASATLASATLSNLLPIPSIRIRCCPKSDLQYTQPVLSTVIRIAPGGCPGSGAAQP